MAKGDLIFTIVNFDHQSSLKGIKEFQKEDQLLFIVQPIKQVDKAFLSINLDRTLRKTLEISFKNFKYEYKLAFEN